MTRTDGLKTAIIGAGHIAQQHLAALRSVGATRVVGVCDLSEAKTSFAAERFRVAGRYTDYRRMLDETRPDVVHVTTPAESHHALGRDALEHGAHVLMEKPITIDPQERESLVALARERDLLLIEDHNYVFNPAIRRLGTLVHDGRLGDVVHVDVVLALSIFGDGSRYSDTNLVHPALGRPAGAISEFLTHLASLAHAFVGPHRGVETTWKAVGDTPGGVPDTLLALVDGERATAALSFSARTRPDAFLVRVHGTRMRAEAHLFDPLLFTEGAERGPGPLRPVLARLDRGVQNLRAAFSSLSSKLRGGPGAYAGLHHLVARSYDAIARGGPPPVTLETMRDVNRLVDDLRAEALPS